jgi:hypothetical protein
MRRPKKTYRDSAFYIPISGRPGVGLQDAYGSSYITAKDGSIRKLESKKHCTKNKR